MAKKKKRSSKKRVSAALSGWLKRQNPAFKKSKSIRIQKLKGGAIKLIPNPVKQYGWGLSENGQIFAVYPDKRTAQSAKKYTFGGRGRVVKVKL
jgi:hypothetical protein